MVRNVNFKGLNFRDVKLTRENREILHSPKITVTTVYMYIKNSGENLAIYI